MTNIGPHSDSTPQTAHPARSRVLLVEDHVDTGAVMARLLESAGHYVRVATDVASALKLAASEPFDVIVSDIGLPDATGYDLMAKIRETHPIKGIALSGYGMEEDIQRSSDAGFAEHMLKPVDMDQLRAAIERLSKEP